MGKAAKKGVQLEFPCLNHGGVRSNSGRKAKRHADGSRVHASHARRAHFSKSRPLHVTIELEPGLPSLRCPRLAPVVCEAIQRANQGDAFRVVHVCLLSNHMHMICEAEGRQELAVGLQGLNVRVAKAINRQLGRSGRVIRERYHVHVLESAAEVRNAVQYVLRNAERHGLFEAWARGGSAPELDPYSSAAWFPYWAERELVLSERQLASSVVRPARTYLMRVAFEGAPLSLETAVRTGERGRPAAGRGSGRARGRGTKEARPDPGWGRGAP